MTRENKNYGGNTIGYSQKNVFHRMRNRKGHTQHLNHQGDGDSSGGSTKVAAVNTDNACQNLEKSNVVSGSAKSDLSRGNQNRDGSKNQQKWNYPLEILWWGKK